MARWTPDPTFYPSPRLAAKAPAETLAYVAAFAPKRDVPDAIAVVDVDPASPTYSKIVGGVDMPNDRRRAASLWLERLQLVPLPQRAAPAYRAALSRRAGSCAPRASTSSTPSPTRRAPTIVRVIEPEEMIEATGYSRPHTVHCGPDGIYVSALGDAKGDAPGGVFLIDPETFDVLGRWEVERGPQRLAYDVWWHLGYDTMVTSEWGDAEHRGERADAGDFARRRNMGGACISGTCRSASICRRSISAPTISSCSSSGRRTIRPRPMASSTAVISLKDLSASIWTWYRDGDNWAVKKIIEIPAEPADPDLLPPVLKGFKAVPPLVTDIDLSMDDRFLYVACWGTGDLRQYDVSDPFNPKLTGKVRIGGIVSRAAHPAASGPLNGGPQMVEISRDGQAGLFHQLALWRGRPAILSGRHRRLDGEARRGRRRRHRIRPEIFRGLAGQLTARIKSVCRAATARRTPTAIRSARTEIDSHRVINRPCHGRASPGHPRL